MEINRATMFDKTDISYLDLVCYEYSYDHSEIEKFLREHGSGAWVVKVAGQTVAYLIWRTEGKELFIDRLGTLRSYRRYRYATALVEVFASAMLELGYESMQTILPEYAVIDEGLGNFITGLGFKYKETKQGHYFHYGKEEPGIVYERKTKYEH